MSTPITDRAIGFKPLHETKLIETARALERIAGDLAEALDSALSLCDGWKMDKERAAYAKWQAMKDEATK